MVKNIHYFSSDSGRIRKRSTQQETVPSACDVDKGILRRTERHSEEPADTEADLIVDSIPGEME